MNTSRAKQILQLALPLILQQLCLQMQIWIDRAMLGHLDPLFFSAIGNAGTPYHMVLSAITAICGGTAIPYLVFVSWILFPKAVNNVIGLCIRGMGDTKWMLYTQIFGTTFMVNAFIIRFFAALMGNVFIQLLLIAVCADMVFGSLRAAKYRKWNSAVGIDGAIRKAGMLACVLLFTAIDMMMHVDVLGWLPAEARNVMDSCGVVKMGVTELFALLFILYEATSVLKNMLLCGLPVPAGLREKLGAWLSTMTEETNVDIVAEKAVTAPMEDVATAAAVRRTYEDDREESGLLDM